MPSGELLGKYRLLKLLARGGMGEVYLARQEGLKGFSKTVVVKKILDGLAEDKAFSEMFINEARLSALLTHPNIVQVFDLGEDENGLYLAMEYVHGHSLRAIETQLQKRSTAMPPELAARICQQALLGLSHAHRAVNDVGQPLNLVHRDVSPDNILVGYDGSVKVTDFGIAKASGLAASRFTQAGVVKGKVAYMPPEQLQAERLDGRTDVYAMGVVLYELLSGKRPFVANTDTQLMLAIVQQQPRPLRDVLDNVDPELERIVLKALEKHPQDRFQSAAEMAEALAAFGQTMRSSLELMAVNRLLIALFGEDSAKPPTTQSLDGVPAQRATSNETRAAPVTVSAAHVMEVDDDDAVKTKTSEAPPLSSARTAASAPPSKLAYVALFAAAVLCSGAVMFVLMNKEAPAQPVAAPKVVEPAPAPPPPPPPEVKTEAPSPAPSPTATPAPAPAVAPAAAPKTGRVEIDVVPWGEVWLGKKSLGITPLDPIPLPAGAQVLVVKNPELNVERRVKVNVPAGGTARVRVNLME